MNDLRSYLRSMAGDDARMVFAIKCGTTLGHLRNVSHGARRAAPELCVEVERHSAGAVACESLRPDLPWSRQTDRSWPGRRGRPLIDFAKAAA